MAQPLKIGLTGNIGSGKSTVARQLVKRGAALIDSDALAKAATRDPDVLRQIADALGNEFVKDGQLDRAKTAQRVFADEQARATLNAIVHPWVRRQSAREVARLTTLPEPPNVILMDIPLLFENGLESTLDAVIVVNAPLEVRVQRVMTRSGLSAAEVRSRNEAQFPLKDKVAKADYVVDNGSSLEHLEAEIERVWRAIQKKGNAHASV